MKYTPSQDGMNRLTIHVQLRFSKDELSALKPLAKQDGFKSVTKWIRVNAMAAWESFETAQWDNFATDDE